MRHDIIDDLDKANALLTAGFSADDEPEPTPPPSANGHSHGDFDLLAFLERNGITVKRSEPYQGGMKYVVPECPFNADHKEPAVIVRPDGKLCYHCWHNSCGCNGWKEYRTHYEPKPEYQPPRQQQPSGSIQPPDGRAIMLLNGAAGAVRNGTPISDVMKSLRADLDDLERTVDAEQTIAPIGIGTLVVDHPRLAEPIVDGLFRRAEVANIIAAPKVGKSWLAYALALCIVLGLRWLDRFPCRRGRVLLIDNELHRATLAHRIPAVAKAMEIRQADYQTDLDVLPLRGQLLDLPAIARVLEKIGPGTYDAIILDAWYRSLPARVSENDNAAVAGLYNLIDQSAQRLGCAWINIHHASKGNQAEKVVTDVGSGAGSQSRAADAHIILRDHVESGVVVLQAVVRSFAPVEPLALRWDFPIWLPASDADPDQLKGGLTRQDERQDERDREGIEKLTVAMKDGPGSVRELRRRAGGMGKARCERLLDVLESDGKVTAEPCIIKGNESRMYRLLDVVQDATYHVPDHRTT